MSKKQVGWCRIKEELVLEAPLLKQPWLQDDMDVYQLTNNYWERWTPETQWYRPINIEDVPEMIKLAMIMLD